MSSSFWKEFKPWAIVGAIVFVLSVIMPLAGANDTIPEETSTPVITEDIGTVTPPTPVWDETVTVDDEDVIALPSTGSGSTAREIVINGHTGWIFIGYSCVWYGGPPGRYAVYGYAYIHSSTYPQHAYSDYYSVRVSPWC